MRVRLCPSVGRVLSLISVVSCVSWLRGLTRVNLCSSDLAYVIACL